MRYLLLLSLLLAPAAHAQLVRRGPTLDRPALAQPFRLDTVVVANGSFEDGLADTAWTDTSRAWGTVICNTVDCGLARGVGPDEEAGRWWAWFGGTLAGDAGWLEQRVTIPPEADTLAFSLAVPSVGQFGYLSLTLDGVELFRVEDPDSARAYERVILDVTGFADGGEHLLRFESETTPDPTRVDSVLNFFVDGVVIDTSAVVVRAETPPRGAEPAVAVYPNPARDRVTVLLGAEGVGLVTVEAFDVLGRRVYAVTEDAGARRLAVPVRAWPAGAYLLRVRTPAGVATQRLSVVR